MSDPAGPLAEPPPLAFATTVDALHALAAFVLAPAQRGAGGGIRLRTTPGGFGTGPRVDGTRLAVEGADLVQVDDAGRVRARDPITTIRAAAAVAGVVPSADPGIGRDVPPFDPDRPLVVDAAGSAWLAAWYAFGAELLAPWGAPVLWPEHFDLAVAATVGGEGVNLGVSPGDATIPSPYVYVGPHDLTGRAGGVWNRPFGAAATWAELHAAAADAADGDVGAAARRFVERALAALSTERS